MRWSLSPGQGRRYDVAEEDEADRTYKVVVNHEEQYSIWFADREPPAGWREVGKEGPKKECLDYINEVWTDMRPLSLRKQMEEAASHLPQPGGRPPLPLCEHVRHELPAPGSAGSCGGRPRVPGHDEDRPGHRGARRRRRLRDRRGGVRPRERDPR